jgi:UDP-N-acetylglucosamine 2-epimerase
MSEVFFKQLGIPEPDVNLGVGSGTHAEQTAAMMPPLERLMRDNAPDWVLIYGDTNSTLAAALTAAKLNLPVAHVEAGLRSYNRTMPEEINRVLSDHVSALLLCPTAVARDNLALEGLTDGVIVTGDIMVDAVQRYVAAAREKSDIHRQSGLDRSSAYALVTIHRPANADSPEALAAIMAALNTLDMPVIFPVHPRTHKLLGQLAIPVRDSVHLVDPVSYIDMLALLDAAAVAITDSGGLQKEAYVLHTPCVTVRPQTEWVETVTSGWNTLVQPEQKAIQDAVARMTGAPPAQHPDFYGDGRAALRIVEALENSIH